MKSISDRALRVLMSWNWPGNVRELENVIERGLTLASSNVVDLDGFPPSMRGAPSILPVGVAVVDEIPPEGLDMEAVLESYERSLLEKALLRTNGRKKKAADLLNLSFRSFRYRLAKLGLSGADDDDGEAS